jgi:hypothetical protein
MRKTACINSEFATSTTGTFWLKNPDYQDVK